MGNKKEVIISRGSGKAQLSQEQIEAMARIINAMKMTPQEKVLLFYYRHFEKTRAKKVARESYGLSITHYGTRFKNDCYNEYAFGRVFGDFGAFHTLMLTKCKIFETDWTKFITEDGGVKK